jgi:cysteinyl-tRNA synthetase
MHEALRDDFNTAEALKELNGLLYDLNTAVDEHATPQLVRNQRKAILEFLDVFGLRALDPPEVDVSVEAQALITQRDAARARKDFDESDRIRAELEAMGYVVRDTAGGTEVHGGEEDEDEDADGGVVAVGADDTGEVDQLDG